MKEMKMNENGQMIRWKGERKNKHSGDGGWELIGLYRVKWCIVLTQEH